VQVIASGKRTKTLKVFFSFFCGKKRNKKSQPGTKQPIPGGVFQFSFCTTVVNSSGSLMC